MITVPDPVEIPICINRPVTKLATLMFFDPDTRELLRTRPNPLCYQQAHRLRGARPAGPPPRPAVEPITVQRRASNSGVIMVAGHKIALGRAHAHTVLTVQVAEHTLTVDLHDGARRTFRRTTTQPVRSWKAQRPREHARPAVVATARPARTTGRPLQPQGCCASLRDRLRRPLTLEPLPTLRQTPSGKATACPSPRAARAHHRRRARGPTFPSPNVKHHLGQERQASGGTRRSRRVGAIRPRATPCYSRRCEAAQ